MTAAEVAGAMGLKLRSYEHFESGAGQLNLERVKAFAEATNSDPYAIIAAVELETPQFASRCADNKLCLILAYALKDFDLDLGEGVDRLEAATLIQRFGVTFHDLAQHVRDRDAAALAWLQRRRDNDPGGGT